MLREKASDRKEKKSKLPNVPVYPLIEHKVHHMKYAVIITADSMG